MVVKTVSRASFVGLIGRAALLCVAVLGVLAWWVPAPLEEAARMDRAPNPARSAWFLVGIQELVSWSTVWIWAPVGLVMLALMLPWVARKGRAHAEWFPSDQRRINVGVLIAVLILLLLTAVGLRFRAENWSFVIPSAHAEGLQRGRVRVEDAGCRRCHRIGGQGGALATNLDRTLRVETREYVIGKIRIPPASMPNFHFKDGDLAAIHVELLELSGRVNQEEKSNSERVVFFEKSPRRKLHAFETACGGCHRMLTGKWGALGRGETGPNLTGLFSPHWPRAVPGGGAWDRTRLSRWVKDPVAMRAETTMPAIRIGVSGLSDILELFGSEADSSKPQGRM